MKRIYEQWTGTAQVITDVRYIVRVAVGLVWCLMGGMMIFTAVESRANEVAAFGTASLLPWAFSVGLAFLLIGIFIEHSGLAYHVRSLRHRRHRHSPSR